MILLQRIKMRSDSPGPDLIATGGQMHPVVEETGFGHREALFGEGVGHVEKATTALLCHAPQFIIRSSNGFRGQAPYLHGHE